MSSTAVGALVGGAACVLAAPYLGRLTLSVPDPDATDWWRGVSASTRRTAVTGGVAAVLGVLAGAAAGWGALLPAFIALAVISAPLVVIDYEKHRLPNRLVFVAALAGAALLTLAALERGAWYDLLRAAEGGAAVFAVLFVLSTFAPRSFGYGDVKLGGIIGGYLGWFGWAYVYYGIFGGFLLGALVSVILLVSRRATMKSSIPFGPMLIFGAMLVLAFGLVPSAVA